MSEGDKENQIDLFDAFGPDDDDSGDEGGFDITAVEDAGMSDMFVEAGEQAEQVVNRQMIGFDDPAIREALQIKNLAQRVKAMKRSHAMQLPEYTQLKGDMVRYESASDINRYFVWDRIFDKASGSVPYPYFDTFTQKVYGLDDKPLTRANVRPYMEALMAADMKNQSAKQTLESLSDWAEHHELNSLIRRMETQTPEWDGTPRLETRLIDWLKPHDTPLTRLVSKQFWLSLYNRVTNPGCLAPLSLALIGHQNIGKSWFPTLICREITGDKDSGPVLLNLHEKDQTSFLRKITGQSVIANVGELVGFNTGEMDNIKAFMTSGFDNFDMKYKDARKVMRQWLIMLDGNRYQGLQRDETGNRRFYPIFCFQTDDEHGKPNWLKENGLEFKFNEPEPFSNAFWQIMAECRQFMKEHGEQGYVDLTREASDGVAEFNKAQMSSGSGTVKDNDAEAWLARILLAADWQTKRAAVAGKGKRAVLFVAKIQAMAREASGRQITPNALVRAMKAMGFEQANQGGMYFYQHWADFGYTGEDEVEAIMRLKKMVVETGSDEPLTPKEIASEIKEARALFRSLKDDF